MQEQEKAFQRLKSALISPQILQYPNFEKEFILKVDSSSLGCGGVLLQEHGDTELPVAYFSKTFKKGEKNKAIIEKELLAIYHSIMAFRPYIYGKKFKVYTDHKPLVYLFTMNNPSSKLVRIKLDLEEFDFDIIYIKGKENVLADALSRIPFSEIKQKDENEKDDDDEQILAVTRSMSRKNEQLKQNELKQAKNDKNSENELKKQETKIFDQTNGYNKKVPRVRTIYDKKKNLLNVNVYLRHKLLFKVTANANVKCKSTLTSIISCVRTAAQNKNLNEIQWSYDDPLFEVFDFEMFNEICAKILKNVKIAMISPTKLVENNEEKQKLIAEYHNDRLRGGHCGRKKVYKRLRANYHWKGMVKDIADYLKNCKSCLLNKPKVKTREPLKITETPERAFDIVEMDTIGPLVKSYNGNLYAVTLQCNLTKYLVAIPIANKEANTVAKAIFEEFILIYGTPKTIMTDCGTEYKNQIIEGLFKMTNIQHNFSTPYHHETMGGIERSHRVLNEYERSYGHTPDWDVQLKYFLYCYNTSYHASVDYQFTPFELLFGRRANEIEALKQPIQPVYNHENYVNILRHTLQVSQQRAKELINKNKMQVKKTYDNKINPIDVKINDFILIKIEPYNKFKPVYSGPHKVKAVNDENVTIEIDKNEHTVHKNRIVKV